MRTWTVRLLAAGAAAITAVTAGAAAWVAPYVLDDLALDRVVRAVALDWRDFGRDRAVERLQYELDHQGIGRQVGDRDCALEDRDDQRVVACRWVVPLRVPGARLTLPLAFDSVAIVDADGDLG